MIREISRWRIMQAAPKPSDERFQLLVENSADMISRHDIAGRFLDVSAAAKSLLGFEPAKLLSLRLDELVHPVDAPAVRNLLDASPNEPTSRAVFRVRTSSGHYAWMEAVAKTFTADDSTNEREI